ncbi:hypothetical protein [Paeniglutamicibacter sp. Y32M11]|uniref:hypothetical protein n=1 Tax=Paeniglutamicibacter sp. Y32M11 TaxID=2853258 RepID=UPI001C52C692|nr:hypothetical protein [Paeniglutamicibacter sp. Y32M11]QXQ09940.1 hypothetical protein KUF55_16105 [Paeniglutamicibacter sp. Y32M11]
MSRRGMQVKALLSMGILVGFGAVSTLAAWTGTATATAEISAAKVSLGVGEMAGATSNDYIVPITGANWYPGMNQAALVVVTNTSPIAVPLSITGSVPDTGTNTLGNALSVVVKAGGSVDGTAPAATCSGTLVINKSAGADFPTATSRPTLAPGASETLCVQYSLPATASNTLQGKSTTVKLTFTATVGS